MRNKSALWLLWGCMVTPLLFAATTTASDLVPQPRITAYANGASEIGVFRGWPIIIKISIEPPVVDGKIVPVTLESQKDWTELLRVDALDEEDRVHAWRFEKSLFSKQSPKIVLDEKHGAFLAYLVSPQESSRIDAGVYKLQVRLRGAVKAESTPVTLKVFDHPTKLPSKGEIARDRLLAMYHALKGEKEEAVKVVEKIKYVPVAAPAPVYAAEYAPQSSATGDLLGMISELGLSGGATSWEDWGVSSYVPDYVDESEYVEEPEYHDEE